jgi:RNA polymerase sigma factor (sigma-70 family)
MSSTHPNNASSAPGAQQFNTTHWSVVQRAGDSWSPQAATALEKLCRDYWYPLYAYVRRSGRSPQDAQDLTQEFFARFLEKRSVKVAAQERGRFRSFLLKSLQHFLINDWVRGQAQKRGGGQKILSLDDEVAERAYREEPGDSLAPERLYDKRWATTLLEKAMTRLDDAYATAGKRDLFNALKGLLLNEASAETYRELGAPLGMSEGAAKVAVHRLRQRFREAVRMEISLTVATPAEVDEELRCLMAALSA